MILEMQAEGGKAVRADVDARAELDRREDLRGRGRLDFLVACCAHVDIAFEKLADDVLDVAQDDDASATATTLSGTCRYCREDGA